MTETSHNPPSYWASISVKDIPIVIASLLISTFIVIGSSIQTSHSIGNLIASPLTILVSCISLILIAFAIWIVLRILFLRIIIKLNKDADQPRASKMPDQRGSTNESAEMTASKDKPSKPGMLDLKNLNVLPVALILIVFWSIYIIAAAPGYVGTDMFFQLSWHMGFFQNSNQHPVFTTLLYGLIFRGGNAIAGPNLGIFLIVIFQTLIMAFSFAFEIKIMKHLKVPRWALITSLVFFAVYPYFGLFCAYAIKDVLFSAVFIVYMSLFILYAADAEWFVNSKQHMIALCVFGILCILSRSAGLNIVLFSLPFLVIFQKGLRQRLLSLIPLLASLILSPVIIFFIMTATNALPNPVSEVLSIPMQQSAYAAIQEDNDLSEYELKVLDETYGLDDLDTRFRYYLADNIKNRYAGGSLSNFADVWVSIGLRHPVEYFDAWANLTYGYWTLDLDPDYPREIGFFKQNTLYWSDEGDPVFENTGDPVFDFSFWMPEGFRNAVLETGEFLAHLPVIAFLAQGGLYTWLVIIMSAFLLYSRTPRSLICLLPFALLMLSLMFSPRNNTLRYFLPDICVMPLMVSSCIFFAKKKILDLRKKERIDQAGNSQGDQIGTYDVTDPYDDPLETTHQSNISENGICIDQSP